MEDIGLTYDKVVKETGVTKAEISRALNGISPNQEKALKYIYKQIEKKRPDVDINEILNS